jgi:biopolymer transport protein ExbB
VNALELFRDGGPAMWPLLALSILSLATIFERLWFWSGILKGERRIASQIIDAARQDWEEATHLAKQATDQPIGRFLYTPLKLANREPEIFRLALETSAEEELNSMRRGDKLLEATIALGPLLGLLGTVLGLMTSLSSIRLGDIGTQATAGATLGISRALITTATGMMVAITALVFYRLFQAFLLQQVRIFHRTGNELELIYRQKWLDAKDPRQTLTRDASY